MNFSRASTLGAFLWCSVVLSGATITASAGAEEDATRIAARVLGTEGVNAYLDEDFQLAESRLESAYAVLRVPSLALWSARALEKNGKLIEAAERYLEATKLPPGTEGKPEVQREAQVDAARERDALLPRIPSVAIHLLGREPEETELSFNGEVVSSSLDQPRAMNPGPAEIIATSGEIERRESLNLSEGEAREVTFRFPPKHPEPPEKADLSQERPSRSGAPSDGDLTGSSARAWQRPAGFVGIGVGASGIVFGAVTGALALGASNQFDCQEGNCPDATDKEISTYNTQRTLSSIGFIAGGVIAGAGLTLVLSSPKKQGAAVSAFFAPTSAGVRGNF